MGQKIHCSHPFFSLGLDDIQHTVPSNITKEIHLKKKLVFCMKSQSGKVFLRPIFTAVLTSLQYKVAGLDLSNNIFITACTVNSGKKTPKNGDCRYNCSYTFLLAISHTMYSNQYKIIRYHRIYYISIF